MIAVTNKVVLGFTLIALVIFLPFILILFNVSGYSQTNSDVFNELTNNDFKLLSVKGVNTFIGFLVDIAKFSVLNIGVFGVLFFLFIDVMALFVAVLILRGGGS